MTAPHPSVVIVPDVHLHLRHTEHHSRLHSSPCSTAGQDQSEGLSGRVLLWGAVLPDPDHHCGPLHHPLSVEEHQRTALQTVVLDWVQQGPRGSSAWYESGVMSVVVQ